MTHAAQERFSLLNQVPLGICVLREDGVVLFWNQCLENWTGIRCDRILEQSITEFFPHFQQARYANRLAEIFKGGAPTIFSSQLHPHLIPAPLPQGWNRIQQTTVTAIPASEGDGFYAMLSIQDVTDVSLQVQEYRQMRDRALTEANQRKLAQERAEVANRVKDEFLAVISHELRTPLNPILGWSRMLRDGRLNLEASQKAIETIARNAALQSQLIDDLLDVSRILRGKLHLNLQSVDLAWVVRAALDTVQIAADAKQIKINFQQTSSLSMIQGDATRLQQVVWNLVSNAIKFTRPGGQVDILLGHENQEILLSVQDTGQGISADFLPYVFESFRQADSSTTRSIGGLGLGLAITRHLVELHGGRVMAESPGLEKGSTFRVMLPTFLLSSQPEIEPDMPSAFQQKEAEQISGLHLLVVDDDRDTRDFLEFLLKESGAIVQTAASVTEAIVVLADQIPDLMISDLGMPEADGYDLIRYVRSQLRLQNIPAIALTAYTAETTQKQVIAAGFQKHLAKPIDAEQLIHVIQQLVPCALMQSH